MSGGISALEGFDYQAMVQLELMLQHFDEHGVTSTARPEGIDDLDLVHHQAGATHRTFVQVKKPRQNVEGDRTPSEWGLQDAVEQLLAPRWHELQQEHTLVRWVLGDSLGEDTAALLETGTSTQSWAARQAAAELVVRTRKLAPLPTACTPPTWQSPFRADTQPNGTLDDVRRQWTESFTKRALLANFDKSSIPIWITAIEEAHGMLAQVLPRVMPYPSYAESAALRERLTLSLVERFGLKELDVRQVVFRNLRGYVEDIARARGMWIDMRKLHNEIVQVWPRRIATVLPPPLPIPHLRRKKWVLELAGRTGAVFGPSGAGKTTSATELFEHLQAAEPNSAVLYAEVRPDTAWRHVMEGIVHAVGRRGEVAPYDLLPSILAGEDEALLSMADALESSAVPVALLVDLVDGTAHPPFGRDLARFAQRLPASSKTRLWIFGQEDALAELADAERNARRLVRVPARGLNWEEFRALAELHGLQGRSKLYAVHDALTAGRETGVAPRVADAVLRLGSLEAALAAARSDDVLLVADSTRFGRLSNQEKDAIGALACLTHPVRVEDAEMMFPFQTMKAGIRAGVRAGLLHPLGDGRIEFHETVRRNLLGQQPYGVRVSHHKCLVDIYSARGEWVLAAHHAEEAGLPDRARDWGRAAFLDPQTADRVWERVMARGWVTAAEVLGLLRADPDGPYGWWRALHEGLDDGTASTLLAWWRDLVGRSGHDRAKWSAPQAMIAARPDLLADLLDVVVRTPSENGHFYAGIILGVALRDHSFDESVLLDRFGRATQNERQVLAETLRGSRTPRCVARWLVHLIESGTPLMRPDNTILSDAHVPAIVEALPDTDPTQLVVQHDWGFGAVTAILWKHRDIVGAGAARLLQDDTLDARHARVSLRLLGVTAHPGLFEAARRWGRSHSDAKSMALIAPLLTDECAWREELAKIVLDSSCDKSARVASYGIYVQSGDGGAALLEKIIEQSPELGAVCCYTAGLSFIMRPSMFALDMLLQHVLQTDDEPMRGFVGTSLAKADHFADGPHARAVTERILPLLAIPHPEIREPVLLTLTMLREPVAREACTSLALAEAGTRVGGLAAVAACASRPDHLSDVGAALEANPGQRWLLSSLAARFEDANAAAQLVAEAGELELPWAARRRALLSLGRLPYAPEVDVAIEAILRERTLLGAHDSPHAQLTEWLVRLIQTDRRLFFDLWRAGEARFINILGTEVKAHKVIFTPATEKQITTCLRTVWRAMKQGLRGKNSEDDVLSMLLNELLRPLVQSVALRVAKKFKNVVLLERVMATSDSPWLAFRALLERATLDPRAPEDATRWTGLLAAGPCGADQALQSSIKGILRSMPPPASGARPKHTGMEAKPQILGAGDLHALLDAEQKAPASARLADMSDEELTALVARLDPGDDHHVVEVLENGGDTRLVSLGAHGATVTSRGSQSTGRKGDRSGLRARLVARFPNRVPSEWLEERHRGHSFVGALVTALADEGDPERALLVLRRLPGDVTGILHASSFNRLGCIADDALVGWASKWAGSGGSDDVKALASFAAHATADAVLSLLARLMRRVEGHFDKEGVFIGREGDDVWKHALTKILLSTRLRDVPGAASWLVKMLSKTLSAFDRAQIVTAMAKFPSTWGVVESEALKVIDYAGPPQFEPWRLDEMAHALFLAPRPVEAASSVGSTS